jgi:hypothetical protein
MLPISSKIEAKNRQFSHLIHNWWDARYDEIRWLPNYETAESKAHRFLQRFIGNAMIVSLELFEDYILSKAKAMYLQMHVEEPRIHALRRGKIH